MTHDEYVAKLAALCNEYKYGPVEARKVLEEHEPEVYPDGGTDKRWALEVRGDVRGGGNDDR